MSAFAEVNDMHKEHDFLDPEFLKPRVLADGNLRAVAVQDEDFPLHHIPRLARK